MQDLPRFLVAENRKCIALELSRNAQSQSALLKFRINALVKELGCFQWRNTVLYQECSLY